MTKHGWSIAGAGGVVILVLLMLVAASRKGLVGLYCGEDGRRSTSKVQFLLWTIAGVFGISQVLIERLLLGHFVVDRPVPQNLLLAMGFGAATMAAAKSITTSSIAAHPGSKTNVADVKGAIETATTVVSKDAKGGIFETDNGSLDLSKVQLFTFTLIAVAYYLVRVLFTSNTTDGVPDFVDIDQTLMILMGLSQGAYLGEKIASAPKKAAA